MSEHHKCLAVFEPHLHGASRALSCAEACLEIGTKPLVLLPFWGNLPRKAGGDADGPNRDAIW